MSYFDDHEDELTGELRFRYRTGALRSGDGPMTSCSRCGAEGLKWRLTDTGDWRLYEETRVNGNLKKQHECNAPSADDFGDIT